MSKWPPEDYIVSRRPDGSTALVRKVKPEALRLRRIAAARARMAQDLEAERAAEQPEGHPAAEAVKGELEELLRRRR